MQSPSPNSTGERRRQRVGLKVRVYSLIINSRVPIPEVRPTNIRFYQRVFMQIMNSRIRVLNAGRGVYKPLDL